MQTVKGILMLSGNSGSWVDEYGAEVDAPEVAIGVKVRLKIDLRTDEVDETGRLIPVALEDFTSDAYRIAVDGDWNLATDPVLKKNSGISVVQENGYVYLKVEMPTPSPTELVEALNNGKNVTFDCETAGISAGGSEEAADFIIQFSLGIRNRLYMGGTITEEVQNDPEYLKAVEVQAMIAAAVAAATRAPAASLEIGTVSSGTTPAASVTGTAPNQTLNLTLPKGADGTTPHIGENGNWYLGTVDTGIAATGEDGESPHIGENGNWFIGTADTGVKAAGTNGKDGESLDWDEVITEESELDAYADREKDFRVAMSTTDATAKTTTTTIWKKRSGDHNDWCTPFIHVAYSAAGKDGANAALIEPLEFTSPTAENVEYLVFDISSHMAVSIAAVCIDTALGEYTLPYNSVFGILKFLRDRTNKKMYVYFGEQIPAYSTGRIYFAQGVTTATSTEDPDTPSWYGKKMIYGYIPSATAGSITSVTQITSAMLAAAADTVVTADASTLGKTSLGVVPEGAWLFALIPANAGLAATKDNGFGGKVAFELNNGVDGTGANGTEITVGETAYRVYGEFKLNAAEIYIYIDEVTNA